MTSRKTRILSKGTLLKGDFNVFQRNNNIFFVASASLSHQLGHIEIIDRINRINMSNSHRL